MPPDPPSISMLHMQGNLQLHSMLTTLTQNLPDQSKFASYTPVHELYRNQLIIKYRIAGVFGQIKSNWQKIV